MGEQAGDHGGGGNTEAAVAWKNQENQEKNQEKIRKNQGKNQEKLGKIREKLGKNQETF